MADGSKEDEEAPDDIALGAVLGKRKTPEPNDETATVQAGLIPPPPTGPNTITRDLKTRSPRNFSWTLTLLIIALFACTVPFRRLVKRTCKAC
jgi:hypothetical protein